jgi:hypothetical protein
MLKVGVAVCAITPLNGMTVLGFHATAKKR